MVYSNYDEVLEPPKVFKEVCPACKRPLYSVLKQTPWGPRYLVWCPRRDCNNMSDGPNEGGWGKTIEQALKVLMTKLRVQDDYQIESDDFNLNNKEIVTEQPAQSNNTGDKNAPDKPKKTKKRRGRVCRDGISAKDKFKNWSIPMKPFTIKEFCEMNSTYPAQALLFFEKNNIVKVGVSPVKAKRGKAAGLYNKKDE